MNIRNWFQGAGGGASRAVLSLTLSLTAAALAPGMVQAQGAGTETQRLHADLERLQRDVQRADTDIRRTDSLMRVEQAAAARAQERLMRDRERREKENAALEERVRDARARIAAEKARGDEAVNAAGEVQAREKAVLALLAQVADSLVVRIDAGIPWDNDTRRARILSLRHDLEAGNASVEEAFVRLGALLREETRGGDEVVLSSRPLTRKNGEVINAQALKIGNQVIVYVDEDGKKFGMLERSEGSGADAWTWREELGLSERTAVKRAIAVKAGRETPQLTALDIPLAGLETGYVAVADDSTRSPHRDPETRGDAQKGGR